MPVPRGLASIPHSRAPAVHMTGQAAHLSHSGETDKARDLVLAVSKAKAAASPFWSHIPSGFVPASG